jgi:hypothetical protein
MVPDVIEHRSVVTGVRRPRSAFFLAIPYGDNSRAIRELTPLYEFGGERRFERDGYAMSLFPLAARTSGPK